MTRKSGDVIICLILVVAVALVLLVNKTVFGRNLIETTGGDYVWIFAGLHNFLGYLVVLLPGFAIYKYVQKIQYLEKAGGGCVPAIIRRCFGEDLFVDGSYVGQQGTQPHLTVAKEIFLLCSYFVGLQVSFLTWGVLQEKVMTQKYTNSDGDIGHFKDSQFLVFVNRILAFCLSGSVILYSRQPRDRSPLYKYVYCSLSNIFSSWCQYEALKYVSFPHQVLAKAAKVIPVMIMGKIVSKTKYEYYEYVTAIILSFGMVIFMLDTGTDKGSTVTTLSGVALLCGYIAADSFTSNWQGSLFKQYGTSPLQMMCAVNMFSCLFTAVSLLQQGGFTDSFYFMSRYPSFIVDCLLLSMCSAGGQFIIFRTIATFGPLVFAIMTTIRQGFAVLLSCIIYNHYISPFGVIGVVLVFLSIFLRIYCSYRIKMIHKRVQITTD